MGPFGYEGAASRSLVFLSRTQASGVVGLGMAFGTDPTTQKHGDVLVSTGLLPYDYRIVRTKNGDIATDYSEVPRHQAKESLMELCRAAADRPEWQKRVHLGWFLSGGARIHCSPFRDLLAAARFKAIGLLAETWRALDFFPDLRRTVQIGFW